MSQNCDRWCQKEHLEKQIESLKAITELKNAEIEKLREIQRLLIFNEEIRDLTPMQKMSLSMKLLSKEGELNAQT